MAKTIRLHPPLAKWSGAARQVRLTLDYNAAHDLYVLLLTVAQTANVPLDTAANAGRRAAQTLATEILQRPALRHYDLGDGLRMTVKQSEGLSLLAWLMSSPHTRKLPTTLQPLLNALHQLLS